MKNTHPVEFPEIPGDPVKHVEEAHPPDHVLENERQPQRQPGVTSTIDEQRDGPGRGHDGMRDA